MFTYSKEHVFKKDKKGLKPLLFIGLHMVLKPAQDSLEDVQNNLFVIGAELAITLPTADSLAQFDNQPTIKSFFCDLQ